MLKGLDASSVQGVLPFDKLGPDLRFVMLKAQQGNDGFDPTYRQNAELAKAHGLRAFPYCFDYPLAHIDPKAQAADFVRKCGEGVTIFLDLEWPEIVKPGGKGWKEWGCSPQQLSDWMAANTAEVFRLSGKRPILYTYPFWWAAVRDGAPAYGFPTGADVSWAAQYPLWIASYIHGWPQISQKPIIPKPWADWLFWQFDGNGGLVLPNGKDADFSVFNGDENALGQL